MKRSRIVQTLIVLSVLYVSALMGGWGFLAGVQYGMAHKKPAVTFIRLKTCEGLQRAYVTIPRTSQTNLTPELVDVDVEGASGLK